jgi:SAM-dependent methyltransferase
MGNTVARFEKILDTSGRVVLQMFDPRGWSSRKTFVESAYKRFLRREADVDGLAHYLNEMETGHLNRWQVVGCFIRSPEFHYMWEVLSGGDTLHMKLHKARCDLVKLLPPADDVLDLGGANADTVEGSLLAMGYPHLAKTITIVDLPPAERFAQIASYAQEQEDAWMSTARGTKIRYLYRSMSNLDDIASESVDLIWSGQTIEHVEKQEAIHVLQEGHRILRLGGYFCLDTPNARLCRMMTPNGFIFPEHKHEYYFEELVAEVRKAGFSVVETKGIGPMPRTLHTRRFDALELYRNTFVCDDAEAAYFFYLKCLKDK